MPFASVPAQDTTVGQLGEAGILELLRTSYQGMTTGPGVIGPGDDAAVIPAPAGKFVIATDAMNEGHHFLRSWPSGLTDNGYSTGWKLAAQNLSDMNAMGAVPSAVSISLAMPKNTTASWVAHFGRGIANACRWLGAPQTVVSGGDLTRADTIATSITATANLVDEPILRTAAEDVTGYQLIHTGNAGLAAAGFAVASHRGAADRFTGRRFGPFVVSSTAASAVSRPRGVGESCSNDGCFGQHLNRRRSSRNGQWAARLY